MSPVFGMAIGANGPNATFEHYVREYIYSNVEHIAYPFSQVINWDALPGTHARFTVFGRYDWPVADTVTWRIRTGGYSDLAPSPYPPSGIEVWRATHTGPSAVRQNVVGDIFVKPSGSENIKLTVLCDVSMAGTEGYIYDPVFLLETFDV